MKKNILIAPRQSEGLVSLGLAFAVLWGFAESATNSWADETFSSPYLARIEGQEEFLYVWTLGIEGLGDGSDKLVVVDVKPGSPGYGTVIHHYSVGGRHEAHHGGRRRKSQPLAAKAGSCPWI